MNFKSWLENKQFQGIDAKSIDWWHKQLPLNLEKVITNYFPQF